MLSLSRYPLVKSSVRTPLSKNLLRCYANGTQTLNGFEKFNQREKAKEDFFIRQHEKEQMEEQVKHYKEKIKHLSSRIEEIDKNHKNNSNNSNNKDKNN